MTLTKLTCDHVQRLRFSVQLLVLDTANHSKLKDLHDMAEVISFALSELEQEFDHNTRAAMHDYGFEVNAGHEFDRQQHG